MLNPELFCSMWYDSVSLGTPIKHPYYIINYMIYTFFSKCYVPCTKNVELFTIKHKSIIDRDTHLFKSIQIQNLLLMRDGLISKLKESSETEYQESKQIFSYITKKIDDIKANDDDRYIFNYKLLDALQSHHSIIKGALLKNIGTKTIDFELVLELYYYKDLLDKSLIRLGDTTPSVSLKSLEYIFTNGGYFSDHPNDTEHNPIEKETYINLIEDTYIKLISKSAQVLTYVKERNDAALYNLPDKYNPRYDISLSYDEITIQDGILKKKEIPVSRDYPINFTEPPRLNFYDFKIKYFNYPHVIGLTNKSKPYFDTLSWQPNTNRTVTKPELYIGAPPTEVNFQIAAAEKFVEDHSLKYSENYYLGKINRYYGNKISSADISKDPQCGKVLLQKLRNFEDIIIVGNGQSGAGKTASLISRGKDHPGILPCLANQLLDSTYNNVANTKQETSHPQQKSEPNDDHIEDYDCTIKNAKSDGAVKIQYFDKARVKLINLYLNLSDNLVEVIDMKQAHYLPYNIVLYLSLIHI